MQKSARRERTPSPKSPFSQEEVLFKKIFIISIDLELCPERAFPPQFEFQAVRALAVVVLRAL